MCNVHVHEYVFSIGETAMEGNSHAYINYTQINQIRIPFELFYFFFLNVAFFFHRVGNSLWERERQWTEGQYSSRSGNGDMNELVSQTCVLVARAI